MDAGPSVRGVSELRCCASHREHDVRRSQPPCNRPPDAASGTGHHSDVGVWPRHAHHCTAMAVDAGRRRQSRQTKEVFDGGQQRRMRVGMRWAHRMLRPENQGEHAVATATVILVPGDEQHAVAHRRRAEDRGHGAPQPGVAKGGRTVVHVVAEVGGDPEEARWRRARQVGRRRGEWHNRRLAATAVVREWVVLDRVSALVVFAV